MPATNTAGGIRAVRGGKPVDPESVRRYLEGKFGGHLRAVRSAMRKLGGAHTPREPARAAYPLYERFRPAIPAGKKGWGARGVLGVGLIERLATEKS